MPALLSSMEIQPLKSASTPSNQHAPWSSGNREQAACAGPDTLSGLPILCLTVHVSCNIARVQQDAGNVGVLQVDCERFIDDVQRRLGCTVVQVRHRASSAQQKVKDRHRLRGGMGAMLLESLNIAPACPCLSIVSSPICISSSCDTTDCLVAMAGNNRRHVDQQGGCLASQEALLQ